MPGMFILHVYSRT